jgi:hypothetical protein
MQFGISEERHDTTDDKVLSSGGKEEEKERITTAAEEGRRNGVEVEVAKIGKSSKGKRSPYAPSKLGIYLGKRRRQPFHHFVFLVYSL